MNKSEFIGESTHDLQACGSGVDAWLIQSIGPIFDATIACPSRGVSAGRVREYLNKEHESKKNQLST